MNLNRTWLLAFTFSLGAIPVEAALAAPPDRSVYSGAVVEETTREPIAGVAVECRFPGDGTAAAARTETDDRGRYSFEVPAGRVIALEFVKPGYARRHRGPFVPGKEPWLSEDVILGRSPESLAPGNSLATGVVRNAATGEPVGGVAVDMCFYGGAHHPDYRTDARGRFAVELPAQEDAECHVLVQAVLPTGGSFEARVPAGPVLVRACGSCRKGGEIVMLAADVPFETTAGETTEARVKLEEVR